MSDEAGSSPREEEADGTSSSPSFPFFNHSTTTLPNNLPPNVDDKPMARQKRKRTSPEDQVVLEAYYARDPKPDKAARLDLVKKVALGEKEVQIWFQNRRQSSRRKSRPLLPHEIAQYQLSKSMVQSDQSPPSLGMQVLHDSSRIYNEKADQDDTIPTETIRHSHTASDNASEQTTSPGLTSLAKDSDDVQAEPLSEPIAESGVALSSHTCLPSASAVGVLGTDRGDGLSSHAARGLDRTWPIQSSPQRAHSSHRLRKSFSFIRLSLNSEGGAEVVAKDSSSPSPPRPVASSQQSGVTSNAARVASNPNVGTGMGLHRVPSGRSRDSRAWEFWCDKDCRTELEEKADKEASGSASDAIQLLRSSSGRSILGPLSAKRNVQPGQIQPSKRLRAGARMPLQRSSTSSGRLQGKALFEGSSKATPKLQNSKTALSVHIPGNDSDKENWSPNSDLPSESAVGDNEAIGTVKNGKLERNATRDGAPKSRRLKARGSSIDPENDPEIAAFMQAGRDSDKVSDHEEMDCVQGLLSLSQGNWR